ncbi:LOW QUALITY PROTEIN: hypothetical protein ACHAWF_018052 [Thalassiosira exigua]
MNELHEVMKVYEENHLPVACGPIDAVHVKWSNCPTGDHNRAKGKASYPTTAFEVITDNDRKIFAIGSAQFVLEMTSTLLNWITMCQRFAPAGITEYAGSSPMEKRSQGRRVCFRYLEKNFGAYLITGSDFETCKLVKWFLYLVVYFII